MTTTILNTIFIIKPYWYNGTWVFDDDRVGLLREAFVAGIPEIINHIVKDVSNAKDGFKLLFSSNFFPDYQLKLKWVKTEGNGNWYHSEDLDINGWLCPALFKYFTEAPKEIYAKAEAIIE